MAKATLVGVVVELDQREKMTRFVGEWRCYQSIYFEQCRTPGVYRLIEVLPSL